MTFFANSIQAASPKLQSSRQMTPAMLRCGRLRWAMNYGRPAWRQRLKFRVYWLNATQYTTLGGWDWVNLQTCQKSRRYPQNLHSATPVGCLPTGRCDGRSAQPVPLTRFQGGSRAGSPPRAAQGCCSQCLGCEISVAAKFGKISNSEETLDWFTPWFHGTCLLFESNAAPFMMQQENTSHEPWSINYINNSQWM